MILPAIRDGSRARCQREKQLELAVVSTGIEKRVDGVEGGIAKRQNVGGQSEVESRGMPTREKELELVARSG